MVLSNLVILRKVRIFLVLCSRLGLCIEFVTCYKVKIK